MFLINDKQTTRHEKIRSYLQKEPVIAVILAAADFEWTARRAILALGRSPTKTINARFDRERKGGPAALKEYWKIEVKPRLKTDLARILPNWGELAKNAYQLRNRLVHGADGSVGNKFAARAVETMLKGSKVIADYALEQGEPVYGKCIRRL
jgi:hypothetical protein